jgi:cytochrome c553
MKTNVWMLSGTVIAALLLPAGAHFLDGPQAQQTDSPPATVMTACTECHTTARICDNLGRKDRGEWTRTIERMASRGADVSPEDIPELAEYLANLKPGSKPVCK